MHTTKYETLKRKHTYYLIHNSVIKLWKNGTLLHLPLVIKYKQIKTSLFFMYQLFFYSYRKILIISTSKIKEEIEPQPIDHLNITTFELVSQNQKSWKLEEFWEQYFYQIKIGSPKCNPQFISMRYNNKNVTQFLNLSRFPLTMDNLVLWKITLFFLTSRILIFILKRLSSIVVGGPRKKK